MAIQFFGIILFILVFLGTIALVFYLTVEFNELEKAVGELSKDITARYGGNDDEKNKKKK